MLIKLLGRGPLRPQGRYTNALRGNCFSIRPRVQSRISQLSFRRLESTAPQAAPEPVIKKSTLKQRFAFPERLCVYHAGTGRVTFLACLKVTTLFVFSFVFVVTPFRFEQQGFSLGVALAIISSLVPITFVAYTTAPFVAFIHLRLPPVARQSEEALRRFARNIPRDSVLEITTMSFIAKPRLTNVRIADLRPVSRRFGLVNMVRDTAAENARRKWYMYRAVGNFRVEANKVPRAPFVWESIKQMIARQG
ncbi:hypothetical protein F4780DRAFT_740642 [Xylariomycetidae sp. FL0641]|nr:hypothetical protein F4780DRAFT_740642 [Xylariomycetidae sp. FL0641]